MTRKATITLLASTLAATLLGGCRRVVLEPGAFRDANVLFIVLDTQRADRLGCCGGPPGLTPFLDSLAARSVVFHRAYATAPWTEPSVASLLTSRLPSQHGVTTFRSVLSDDETTFPELLHDRGFATQGFVANIIVDGRGLVQGFDGFLPLRMVHDPRVKGRGVNAGGELLRARAVDWALDLAADHRRGKSLLYLQYMEPHAETLPDDDALELVARARGRWPMNVERIQMLRYFVGATAQLPEDISPLRDYYDATVLTLDRRLAGLFEDLGRLGFLDRAIVVVVADHGEEIFDHTDNIGHGYSLYEEVVRVPLLISVPGQQERVDVDEVVSLLDVAPTVLDLLGIEAPSAFAGRTLCPLVSAADSPWTRLRRAFGRRARGEVPVFSELLTLAIPESPRLTPHRRAVVQGDRKLIERAGGGYDLFDIAHDPEERVERQATEVEVAAFAPALRWLEAHAASGPSAGTNERPLSPEEVEQLRALGYVD